MIGYKLFRVRRDGSLGPLFINRQQRIEVGVWYDAECHPTKGYALRPGWHVCSEKNAPHLSKKGRVWHKVEIEDYAAHTRPASQGGVWFIANRMRVLEQVSDDAGMDFLSQINLEFSSLMDETTVLFKDVELMNCALERTQRAAWLSRILIVLDESGETDALLKYMTETTDHPITAITAA